MDQMHGRNHTNSSLYAAMRSTNPSLVNFFALFIQKERKLYRAIHFFLEYLAMVSRLLLRSCFIAPMRFVLRWYLSVFLEDKKVKYELRRRCFV